jgi:hypothetical protein
LLKLILNIITYTSLFCDFDSHLFFCGGIIKSMHATDALCYQLRDLKKNIKITKI